VLSGRSAITSVLLAGALPSVGQASSFAAVAAVVVVLPVDGVAVELELDVACAVERDSGVVALMFGFAVRWTAAAAAVAAAAVVATSSPSPSFLTAVVAVVPCVSLAAVVFVAGQGAVVVVFVVEAVVVAQRRHPASRPSGSCDHPPLPPVPCALSVPLCVLHVALHADVVGLAVEQTWQVPLPTFASCSRESEQLSLPPAAEVDPSARSGCCCLGHDRPAPCHRHGERDRDVLIDPVWAAVRQNATHVAAPGPVLRRSGSSRASLQPP